jgi:hypothetical protein
MKLPNIVARMKQGTQLPHWEANRQCDASLLPFPLLNSFFRNVDTRVEPHRNIPVGDGLGSIRTLKVWL